MAVHENLLFPQFCQYKEYNAGPFYKHILLELMVLLATLECLSTTGPPLVMIMGTVS